MEQKPFQIHNPVIKDTLTFLETCAQSGGARTVAEIELAPGGGNPLHIHQSYDEHFEVLEGRLGVQVGTEKRILAAGENATVGRGTVHRFFSGDDNACTFRVTLTPGHTGFEQSLCIVYGLAADGLTNQKSIPKSITHLALLGDMGEMRLTGPLGLMTPLFRILAGRARKRGLDQELIRRYAADLPR
jgi:quercetin dioxygenase-like cupin family protein